MPLIGPSPDCRSRAIRSGAAHIQSDPARDSGRIFFNWLRRRSEISGFLILPLPRNMNRNMNGCHVSHGSQV